MKKFFFLSAAVFFAFSAHAVAFEAHAELDINGAFVRSGKGVFPAGWLLHTWEGYKPFATVESAHGPDGMRAIRIGNVTSKNGTCFRNATKFACRAGDTVRISFLARGSGCIRTGCYLYSETKGWNGSTAEENFALTDDWRLYAYDCAIVDKPKAKTGFCEVEIGGKTGLVAEIADVRATLVSGGLAEQRKMRRRVTPVRTLRHDAYEESRSRPGAPELVTGPIAPGLLTPTAMGAYQTAGAVAIESPGERFHLPMGTDEVFSASYRLYGFGRGGRVTDARIVETFASADQALSVAVWPAKDAGTIEGEVLQERARLGRFRVSLEALPCDIRADISREGIVITLTSLSSSREWRFSFASPGLFAQGAFAVSQTLEAIGGGRAEAVIDERRLALSRVTAEDGRVPYRIEKLPSFDPVKAGWPLIFEDDFNGTSLDTNKWYFPHYAGKHKECFSLDGKGHLLLKADWDETKPGSLKTDGIWSKTASTYGYFVARLKFTQAPGWWAAFWLYGVQNENPFLDGFEIDIFEDYYTRAKPGQKSRKILDHNNHVRMDGVTKSWNYNSVLPGEIRDWYELGCRWTPFEISYYLNGRLIASRAAHSDHGSVTFDAIQHFAGIAPLHAIISGQKMKNPSIPIDPAQIPETFEVDWVRIYGYPDPPGESPALSWSSTTASDAVMQPVGSRLAFSVSATPGAKSHSPVNAVYLFDNGYLVDFRTAPPYVFDIPFNAAFYETTRYMKPGRSGQKPAFSASPHVFVAFAQDAAGRVSHTDPLIRIPVAATCAPYGGVAQKIPGTISAVLFDAGGFGTSCYTAKKVNQHWAPIRKNDGVTASKSGWVGTLYAGDWLNYSVDIAAEGRYRVKTTLQIGIRGNVAATLLLDGRKIGRFTFDGCTYWKQTTSEAGSIETALPAGRHVLTFVCEGGLHFKEFIFERID